MIASIVLLQEALADLVSPRCIHQTGSDPGTAVASEASGR